MTAGEVALLVVGAGFPALAILWIVYESLTGQYKRGRDDGYAAALYDVATRNVLIADPPARDTDVDPVPTTREVL